MSQTEKEEMITEEEETTDLEVVEEALTHDSKIEVTIVLTEVGIVAEVASKAVKREKTMPSKETTLKATEEEASEVETEVAIEEEEAIKKTVMITEEATLSLETGKLSNYVML